MKYLIKWVKSKNKAGVIVNNSLIGILDTIFTEDQDLRVKTKTIIEKYGSNSNEIKEHWKTIKEKDSINLIKIKKILDERGWLGSDIIGVQGNITLFLVIQHADIETQKKYLPMLQSAVHKGDAGAKHLALLEDRIAVSEGKLQIYGSQIGRDTKTGNYYVLPLIDPQNVDTRRSEVGLGPIQNYIANWDIVWDAKI